MSIEQTLAQRQNTHGDFSDNSRIAQAIKDTMRNSKNWWELSDVQREALEMIAHKISRILSGDPNYADTWHDIGGYAKLAEDRVGIGEIPPSYELPKVFLETINKDFPHNITANATAEGMYPLTKPRETPLPVPEDQHPV